MYRRFRRLVQKLCFCPSEGKNHESFGWWATIILSSWIVGRIESWDFALRRLERRERDIFGHACRMEVEPQLKGWERDTVVQMDSEVVDC